MFKFILESNDGIKFTVDEDVAYQSKMIKRMVKDLDIKDPESSFLKEPIRIPDIDGWTLEQIITWCTWHRGEEYVPKGKFEDRRIELTSVEKKFLDVPKKKLIKLVSGASFLDIKGLHEICCQAIANFWIEGKSTEELRRLFKLPDDLTPEEKKEIRERHEWTQS